MARKLREVIDEVEGVVVRFLGHVRHDGRDYHAGDTATVLPEHVGPLLDAHAAETVTAIEPPLAEGGAASNGEGAAPAAPDADKPAVAE